MEDFRLVVVGVVSGIMVVLVIAVAAVVVVVVIDIIVVVVIDVEGDWPFPVAAFVDVVVIGSIRNPAAVVIYMVVHMGAVDVVIAVWSHSGVGMVVVAVVKQSMQYKY